MPNSQAAPKRPRISNIAKVAIATILAVVAITYVVWDVVSGGPITSFLTDRQKIESWISSLGPAAPLGFIALQVTQTVLAPIPGAVTGLAGGYIFGWWGVLWTLIGSGIGVLIIYYLSKKFGRPLVEKLFKPESVEKFDFLIGRHAEPALFIAFLFPLFPDDMLCYLAGLTEITAPRLLLIVSIGHLPSFIISNYLGMSLGENNLTGIIIIAIVLVVLCGVVYFFRHRLMALLKKYVSTTPPKKHIDKK